MKKIKNKIELVSLHIPKTAGTAFRQIFVQNVGLKHFAKVDIYNSGRLKINDEYSTKTKLGRKINAIHGHFSYNHLHQYFELAPHTQFITWVREPVARVLSNYYFLKSVVAERLQEKEDENLFNRIGKSLEEFVNLEENQNVMSKFLKDAPLENFKFIGLQDNFAQELNRLQGIMGWPQVQNEVHNATKNKNQAIEPYLIELIKTKNATDLELYNYVLELNSHQSSLSQ